MKSIKNPIQIVKCKILQKSYRSPTDVYGKLSFGIQGTLENQRKYSLQKQYFGLEALQNSRACSLLFSDRFHHKPTFCLSLYTELPTEV